MITLQVTIELFLNETTLLWYAKVSRKDGSCFWTGDYSTPEGALEEVVRRIRK